MALQLWPLLAEHEQRLAAPAPGEDGRAGGLDVRQRGACDEPCPRRVELAAAERALEPRGPNEQ